MSKEEILRELQDLILTLQSSNIREEKIQGLWKEKRELVERSLEGLTRADRLWLDVEYQKWHELNIMPKVDETSKNLSDSIFPLI